MAQIDTTNTFIDGDIVHAADLNNMIDQATALIGLISAQTIDNTPTPANDYVMYYDPAGAGTLKRCLINKLPSGVTSVGMTATPTSVFGVTVTTPTTAPAIALSLDDQAPNKVLAGPATGAVNATPSFRALTPPDTAMARTLTANTIDLTLGNYWIKQLSGSAGTITLHLNGGIAGQIVTVYLFQGTAPAQTLVNWDTQDTDPGAFVGWPGGVHPVMTRFVVGASDMYRFVCAGAGLYFGTFDQNFKP